MKKTTHFGLFLLSIVLIGFLPVKAQTSLFFVDKASKVTAYTFASGDKMYPSTPISTNTSNVCNGATYRCQLSEFILELQSTSVSELVLQGTSSGSSIRNIKEVAVSDTKDGVYTVVAGTLSESTITSKENCGTTSITDVNIPQGKFVKVTLSGNVNLSCIDITPAPSSDVKYVLSTTVLPSASVGAIVLNPEGTAVDGGFEYAEYTSVTLTAEPSLGYEFVRWGDMDAENDAANNPERIISMNGAKSVTAVFELDVTAPQLTSVSHADGAVVTLYSTTIGTETISLSFNESVQIADANGISVNGTPVNALLNDDATEISFDVNIDTEVAVTYTIAIAADAIKDLSGNSLAATSFAFTVEVSNEALPIYSLTSTDIETNGRPEWISLGSPIAAGSSYGACVTGYVLKVDKNRTTAISLDKCGKLQLELGTNAGNSLQNILTLTVQVGNDTPYTKTIVKNDCENNILSIDVNSCEPVVVSLTTDANSALAIVGVKAFDYTCYKLTVSDCVNGSIEVSPESASGFYPENTTVTLTAFAETGYVFSAWTHDLVANRTEEGTTKDVIMDDHKTVGASFQMTTGVEESVAAPNIVSVRYYTATGIEIDSTVKGIVIVQTTYEDGTVKTSKEVRR